MIFVVCNGAHEVRWIKSQIADLGENPNDRRIVWITDQWHSEKLHGIRRAPYYLHSWPPRSQRIAQDLLVRQFKQVKFITDIVTHLKTEQP